jgi:hypothetical protein
MTYDELSSLRLPVLIIHFKNGWFSSKMSRIFIGEGEGQGSW